MTPLDADKDNNEMIESSKLLHDPQASVHRLTPFDADEDNNEMTESSRLLSEHYNGLQVLHSSVYYVLQFLLSLLNHKYAYNVTSVFFNQIFFILKADGSLRKKL